MYFAGVKVLAIFDRHILLPQFSFQSLSLMAEEENTNEIKQNTIHCVNK